MNLIAKYLFVFDVLLNFSSQLLAAEYGVLFVPGSFSEVDPTQIGRTFLTQKDLLDRAGIPWKEVRIDSTERYQASVPGFIDDILSFKHDKYIIVSHSMGGLIALEALISSPSLQRNLVGWIAYRSPFFGASIIDRTSIYLDFFDPFRLRRLLSVSRCSGSCSMEERQPYMRKHEKEIRQLTSARPVVSIGSDMGRGTDMVVDTSSTELPGSFHLIIKGASHTELAIGRSRSSSAGAEFKKAINVFHLGMDSLVDSPHFSEGVCSGMGMKSKLGF